MQEIFGTPEEVRARISSKMLLQALDYWQGLPQNNGLPGRRSIDPMAIPKLLPTTFIVVADDDGEFRYQLAGSLLEEKYRVGSVKGKTPQEIVGDASGNVIAPYKRVRDEAVLFYREATLEWMSDDRKFTHYLALLMPLSDDGRKVNMIFGVHEFIRAPILE